MTNHETFIQYVKIVLGTIALVVVTAGLSEIIRLLTIIANK